MLRHFIVEPKRLSPVEWFLTSWILERETQAVMFRETCRLFGWLVSNKNSLTDVSLTL